MGSQLLRITAPHFVAGVEVGRRAAPIVRFMARWPIDRVVGYCEAQRWRVEVVDG